MEALIGDVCEFRSVNTTWLPEVENIQWQNNFRRLICSFRVYQVQAVGVSLANYFTFRKILFGSN